MELSGEGVQRVIDHMQKWKTPSCAICGRDDWAVSRTVFALPDFRSPSAAVYNVQGVFPAIPITCKNCGNVLLLSAIAAGVVPGQIKVSQNA